MGKVIAKFTLTNYTDLVARDLKVLKGKPHSLEVEALVDTGATRLYLKPTVIKKLGLTKTGTVNSRNTNGNRERGVYSPVKMEMMGRSGEFAVVDIEEDVPNRLGQIPLEYLNFVVDQKDRKLHADPEHGAEWMTEEYLAHSALPRRSGQQLSVRPPFHSSTGNGSSSTTSTRIASMEKIHNALKAFGVFFLLLLAGCEHSEDAVKLGTVALSSSGTTDLPVAISKNPAAWRLRFSSPDVTYGKSKTTDKVAIYIRNDDDVPLTLGVSPIRGLRTIQPKETELVFDGTLDQMLLFGQGHDELVLHSSRERKLKASLKFVHKFHYIKIHIKVSLWELVHGL